MKISKTLAKAFKLLKKVKSKARKGIGNHEDNSCPINRGYGICGNAEWDFLSQREIDFMSAKGWTQKIYENFIFWYDSEISFGEHKERTSTGETSKILRRVLK